MVSLSNINGSQSLRALPCEGLARLTSSNARMRTQLFGVLRSYNGLNKVETNSSVISKGIAVSYRINLCCGTRVHMNTNSFDEWSESVVPDC